MSSPSRVLLVILCAACLFALLPLAWAAPPTLTFLFPAGAQVGTTVEVTAAGTFERWPVLAWVDGQGVEVKPAKEKGKLSVDVAADASPGLYWIRFHDEQGASSLRRFIVGTLPELLEQEPNDDFKKPQVLASSAVVNGRLNPAADVDCFALKLRKGQTLVVSMEANRRLGSPMDAILQVVSTDGFVLEQNNDYNDLDPQVVFVAPADAIYVVRTFAFPATPDSSIKFAGGEAFIYRLTLTTGGFVEYPFPLAVSRSKPGDVELVGWNIPKDAKKLGLLPGEATSTLRLGHPGVANDTLVSVEPHPTAVSMRASDPKTPQMIQLPITISGRIEQRGEVAVFQFGATKGQKLLFQVQSRALGYPLDAVLRLTDAAGETLAQVDDPGSRRDPTRDPELSITVSQDDTYRIEIRDLHGEGGFRYVYRLRALFAEPDFDLSLATDRFVAASGKPLDVPVTIERRNGWDRDIEISAEGLPEGVTATPVKATGTSKTVTLRLTAKESPLSTSFGVVGKSSDISRTSRSTIAGLSATTTHLWLTVLKPGVEPEKPVAEQKKKK